MGRLLSLQSLPSMRVIDDDVDNSPIVPAYLVVKRRSDPSDERTSIEMSPTLDAAAGRMEYASGLLPATKKSSYKALKKFSGSASRNCFFTPVQCKLVA